MPSVEQLYGAHFRGMARMQVSGARVGEVFAGRTTVDSGSTSVTVSTTLIAADSVVNATVQAGSMGTNSAGAIVVNSIVAGVSFALARDNGVAQQWDDVVMWQLWGT